MAQNSVVVKYLVELPQFEEYYLVKVFLLNLPVLLHGAGEGMPLVRRHVYCRWFVVFVMRPSLFCIHQSAFTHEHRQLVFPVITFLLFLRGDEGRE